MRELQEIQAVVMHRSEQKIKARKKRRNRILMTCIPMVLGVTVVTTAVTVASTADNGHIQPVTRPPAALNSQEEPTPVVNGDAM